jgi:hypothetical protein
MTTNDLLTRAMLVNLSISSWSASKFDKKVTRETNEAHGAAENAGRYNKSLMPDDAEAYKALQKHIASVRQDIHYAQTLPWSDTGWRLLPIKNYQAYTDSIRKAQHEFESLRDTFIAEYPTLRENARVKLNGMYREADYPRYIGDRYSMSVEYSPVPAGTDFRVTLADEEIATIAARTEERVKQAFQDAMTGPKGAVPRLYEIVANIQAKLSDPKAIFRDSLIGNARELCDILTRLNVTDDSTLESLRRQTEILAASDPQTLRDNPDVRVSTANEAQAILDAMTATYGKGIFA